MPPGKIKNIFTKIIIINYNWLDLSPLKYINLVKNSDALKLCSDPKIRKKIDKQKDSPLLGER